MEDGKQEFIHDAASEVTNLNIENLDVEELERRLELVAAAPGDASLAPGCGAHWSWATA